MTVNKRVTVAMFFIFAVALASGSFFEIYMKGAGKQQLMELLGGLLADGQTQSFFATFWQSLRAWLLMLAVISAVPFLPPLLLLCPVFPALKGLSLGFSATMLVEAFGPEGAWYIFATILPHTLLQIPLLCFMTGFVTSGATKKALRKNARPYFLCCGAAAGLIFISCLLEAFLTQFLL